MANLTDPARRVMRLANEEARRFSHEYIGTEHVLLALLREGSGLGAKVLASLGVELRMVRLEVEKIVQVGPGTVTLGQLPQTPRVQRALAFAAEEAHALQHHFLGTEHLLLGLLREEDGVAAQVLLRLGVNLERVRQVVVHLGAHTADSEAASGSPAEAGATPASLPAQERQTSQAEPAATSAYAAFTGQARRVLLLAHREAHRFGHDYVGTEHILLGVLQEGSGRVAALLTAFGVSVEAVRVEVEKTVRPGPEVTVGARLPLTPPARRALNFAAEEAARLHHDRVGPEHLLLGVLHEEGAEASRVLLGMGLDLGRLSDEILKLPPPEDRNAMVQPAGTPGATLAPDPSPWELERLLTPDVSAAPPPAFTRREPPAGPLIPPPSAAGLALQLRITQLVLGALAGGLAGALIRGRAGAILGVVAGIIVAVVRSTALGVVAGLAAGLMVAARQAPRSPGYQFLAVLTGCVVGGCFGHFLSGFAREQPPEERGQPRGGAGTEDQVDDVRRQ